MSDDPLSRIPEHDRVSIRAVLVSQGEDPTAALARAGIFDAVAIPVVVGEDVNLPEGILGGGGTPNLTAVLETQNEGDDSGDASSEDEEPKSEPTADAGQPLEPGTTMLPAVYGVQPLAPVRKITGLQG